MSFATFLDEARDERSKTVVTTRSRERHATFIDAASPMKSIYLQAGKGQTGGTDMVTGAGVESIEWSDLSLLVRNTNCRVPDSSLISYRFSSGTLREYQWW
ncbi:hypothetical protein NL676_034387 [Syzygium grande]|nr:hypothetical protein NL676_034387 [Syzygium grande]